MMLDIDFSLAEIELREANRKRLEEAKERVLNPSIDFEMPSGLGSFARAGGDLAITMKSRSMTPRGMLGGATPQSKWAANLCYVTENWLCPSLDEIRAYDHMVSICGYNQAGRAIDLSGKNIMPRQNFSYVQTQNANINGDLGIYKEAIEAAFNNGIRFWNPSFVGALGSYPDTVIQTNTPIQR